jgi:hypothetical protein
MNAPFAPTRQTVTVCSTTFGASTRYRVLVGGEYYDVGQADFELLNEGMTPADLDLRPAFDEPDEPDFTEADRQRAMRDSGAIRYPRMT